MANFWIEKVEFMLRPDHILINCQAYIWLDEHTRQVITDIIISRDMMIGLATDNPASIKGFKMLLEKEMKKDNPTFCS